MNNDRVSDFRDYWYDFICSFLAATGGLPENDFDPDRHFAELGLDSFGAQRLRRLISQQSGAQLPLTSFLGAQAPRGVAEALRDRAPLAPAGAESAVPIRPGTPESAGLTPVQAAYWVGRRSDFPLGGVATFWYQEYEREPIAATVESDVDSLEVAWNRLIDHHPMLRATVGRDGRQRCAPTVARYAIARTDLRQFSAPAAAERLARLRHDRSHQVRDPQSWPLFDIHAVYLPDGMVRMLVGFDVLMLDFASWRLLMSQWGELMSEPETTLPAPSIGFLDIVAHRQTDGTERARRERARQYWLDRLDTIPSGPRLPLRRAVDEITAPRFARSERRLPAVQWERLRSRCAEYGVSPTAVLLAAFGLTLHRWGATERFALNATLFDRPDNVPGVDQLVGDFTTTALVSLPQIEMLRWPGFAAFARQVNHDLWEAIDHRAYSAVELMRDLSGGIGSADAGSTVTHPVVFTSGLGVGDETAPGRWLGPEVFGLSQTPQVLIDHLVWQEDGDLRIIFDTVIDAFPEGYVDGLVEAQHRLLRLLSADPLAWSVADLGWAPDYARQEPLDALPFPGAGPLIDDPRREHVLRRPGLPAILTSAGSLSHGELDERAQAVAGLLGQLGVGTGDLVLVAVPKCPAQIIAVLGIELAGAGYVPVNTDWPAVRVAAVCERAGIRHALLLDGAPVKLPAGVVAGTLDADGRPPAGTPVAPAAGAAAPDDLAYAIFTSGSTGVPKGVAIEHRQARTTIDDITDRFGITSDDRLLGLSALSFDLSVYDVFGLLGAGGTLVLPDTARQRDPQHWCELIGQFGVTVWNTAPALLEILVEYAESDSVAARNLASLRLVMLSGDWIPVTLPDRLRELAPGVRIDSLGGATEASIWSITYPVGKVHPDWPSIPYGRPLRAQFFHVLDEAGRPCPVGEVGELFIGGDGVARGYLGDPVQTWERFITHPVLGERLYRTGDLGRWRYDGNIQFMGRSDRQVKVNGHRIELGEVEVVLSRLADVRQVVASALAGPDGRPRLVAHVATSAATDERALAAAAREHLPEYMVPSRIMLLDDMPVTDNGKVDYRSLPNPFRGGRAAASAPDNPLPEGSAPAGPPAGDTAPPAPDPIPSAPITPVEHPRKHGAPPWPALGDAVRDILGNAVDVDAGLVAAGATSLDVVRLANVIEDLTGDRPSLPDLHAFTSLRTLIAAYTPAQIAHPAPAPVPVLVPPTEAARELRLDVPRGMDLAIRIKLPPDRPLADTLLEAGRWLREVQGLLVGTGYQVRERLSPGDGDILELHLESPAAAGPDPGTSLAEPPVPVVAAPTAPAPVTSVPAPPPVPVEPGEPFALTEMQLAYYLGRADTWLGSAVAPHYYTEVDVLDLDQDRFAAALRTVVARHPMLRATLTQDTRQIIREHVPDAPTTVVDLRHVTPAEQRERLSRIREEHSHRVHDPTTWPLFAIVVTLLDKRTSRVHFGLDLLFCDAKSAVTVAEELFLAYTRPEAMPPAPAISFTDWVAEVRSAQRGERRRRALDYWQRAADEMRDGPALPLRVPTQARYHRHRAVLPPVVWDRLRLVAQQAEVTPAALLLTAFGDVLRMAGGGDRFTLVITTFDRPTAHRGVVGDYTSTVLLDVDHREQSSFGERAAALQRRLWADLEHSTGPHGVHGNEVLRELNARRRRQVPLPVVFSSGLGSTTTADGQGADASELLGAFGTTTYAISQTPRVALDNQIFEHGGELRINWDAVDAAFPPAYVDALIAAYVQLLHAVAEPARWREADPAELAGALAAAGQTPDGWDSAAPTALWSAGGGTATGDHRSASSLSRTVAEALAGELAAEPGSLAQDSSFFDLGATSLTLVKVHRRLRDLLGDRVTVLDLFAYPSIRALAAYLDRPAPDASTSPIANTSADFDLDPVVAAARRRGAARRERLAARAGS
ncbi:non-ribosomal peptide synthetase [Micromonospora sp. WMMD1082]|uniref:non-ribosomal peptide synthetase n=1 Tax=Micromonospora sp. WMMD1082 TaxID=3016104 RepID=UPI002415B503|nr:non-ribosomal peptide synthetase [Micromonospora sp. WMMD1082]MDG4795587.1 amino acid adenylation domain-containing protein [Micromonospora sp. WMMD1082]